MLLVNVLMGKPHKLVPGRKEPYSDWTTNKRMNHLVVDDVTQSCAVNIIIVLSTLRFS